MKLLKNKAGAMDDEDKDDKKGEGVVERRERDDGRERGDVFDRLDMGRSWNRAEDRMERQRSGRYKTESPRKKRSSHGERDLRTKLKKSLKSHNLEEPSENVKFTNPISTKPDEYETDEDVLNRRDKQMEYGKNTIDYDTYCRIIPKDERTDTMPRTPNKHKKYSRRQWDGMVKNWKQMIHKVVATYNENNENEDMDESSEEGASGSVGNWADEVEEEEENKDRRRRRVEDEEDFVDQ